MICAACQSNAQRHHFLPFRLNLIFSPNDTSRIYVDNVGQALFS